MIAAGCWLASKHAMKIKVVQEASGFVSNRMWFGACALSQGDIVPTKAAETAGRVLESSAVGQHM